MQYFIVFIIIPLFFIACGGGGSNNTSLIQAPLTQGDWYRPKTDTSWQWQLTGPLNLSYPVQVYDIDLFDTDAATIKTLHQQGAKVICYFSAGSYENWREDRDDFPSELLGNNLDGWAGEKWLDISAAALRPIMTARLDLAKAKGCDGVEPDNIDGYANNSGFALSETDQLAYNTFLSVEAHQRALSIGLKNDLEQVTSLEPYFDFAINEQCHQYNECDRLTPFIQNNKPVFNAEYNKAYVDNTNNKRDLMCAESLSLKFQTLILPLNLDDSFRITCN